MHGDGAVSFKENRRVVGNMREDENNAPSDAERGQQPRGVEIGIQFVVIESEQRHETHPESQEEDDDCADYRPGLPGSDSGNDCEERHEC